MKVTFTALQNIPLIQKGDDLANIIFDALAENQLTLQNGDILVLAQKIVSKAEGRTVDLCTVTPSAKAHEMAHLSNKDPRYVEVVMSETQEVLKAVKENLIVRHKLGYVCANAGIDCSNVSHDADKVLLLPEDPDRSCSELRSKMYELTGANIGVIINDSHGRPWRQGVVGVSLGVSGIPALVDKRGSPDLFNRELKITTIAYADELAAAASLLMGQANEGTPVVHIRGLSCEQREASVKEILRPKEQDLFI